MKLEDYKNSARFPSTNNRNEEIHSAEELSSGQRPEDLEIGAPLEQMEVNIQEIADDPVRLYLHEIGKVHLLAAKDERSLASSAVVPPASASKINAASLFASKPRRNLSRKRRTQLVYFGSIWLSGMFLLIRASRCSQIAVSSLFLSDGRLSVCCQTMKISRCSLFSKYSGKRCSLLLLSSGCCSSKVRQYSSNGLETSERTVWVTTSCLGRRVLLSCFILLRASSNFR